MRFARLSIRLRITAGSVLIAAIVFAVAFLAFRASLSSILGASDAGLARDDLAAYISDIQNNKGEQVDPPNTGILVLIRDPSGAVKLDTLPAGISTAVAGRPAAEETLMLSDQGAPYVVVGRTTTVAGATWSLWAARNTEASSRSLNSIDLALLVGAGIGLVVFGLTAWLLAFAALRPVAAMRRKAHQLDPAAGELLPVGRARDELSELAGTLNELIQRERASAEREKQMVSDAAHELRTPLAALTTQLELAHDQHGDAAALEGELTAAERSVERLVSLTANLLELSRLENAPHPQRSRLDLLERELHGAIDRGRMLALAGGTEVGFEVRIEHPDAAVELGAPAFGRLVDNLVANAVHALGAGGHVEVRLIETGYGIRVEVDDDGPGMPESFLARAFDRFSRADPSRSSTGGTGLGLALVQATARAAGGEATITPLNPGLRVTVHFPKM